MRLFITMMVGIHTQEVKPFRMGNKSLIGSTARIAYNVWCYEQVCLAGCSNLGQMSLAILLIARVMLSLRFIYHKTPIEALKTFLFFCVVAK
jgi:hypothetical protein